MRYNRFQVGSHGSISWVLWVSGWFPLSLKRIPRLDVGVLWVLGGVPWVPGGIKVRGD